MTKEMTPEEKAQAQDVLDGLLRDAYGQGYGQGFKDGLIAGGGSATTGEEQKPQEPKAVKTCLDCKHCHTFCSLSDKHYCMLASRIELDPVTGIMCYSEKVHCKNERRDGECGPEGKNFEMRQKRSIRKNLFR